MLRVYKSLLSNGVFCSKGLNKIVLSERRRYVFGAQARSGASRNSELNFEVLYSICHYNRELGVTIRTRSNRCGCSYCIGTYRGGYSSVYRIGIGSYICYEGSP